MISLCSIMLSSNHNKLTITLLIIFTNIHTNIVVAVAIMATPVTNSGKCYVAKMLVNEVSHCYNYIES